MKYLVIIPARGGSKRLPGKNIMLLNGVPLLAYSIAYAKKVLPDSPLYVSTDSDEIAAVARQYGAGVIRRPDALAGDFCPTAPVLEHAVHELGSETFDYVLWLQPINPLRPEGLMERALERLATGDYDSLFTVSPSTRKLGKIEQNRFIPWNYTFGQRSQDMEPLYYENGLLNFCRCDLILQGRLFGDTLYPLIVDHVYGTLDIDTREDFDLVDYYVHKDGIQLALTEPSCHTEEGSCKRL